MITKNTQLVSTEEHTLYAIWDEYPTCEITAIKNSTTVTAVPKDDNNALVYYGWSSSYSGENKTEKVINGTGTITYYVKDALGGTGSCSAEIKNTTNDCGGKTAYNGQCCTKYTKYSGTCQCEYYWDCGGSSYCHKTYNCDPTSGCSKCTGKVVSGCDSAPAYKNCESPSKVCSSGTKLSNSYCFKAK